MTSRPFVPPSTISRVVYRETLLRGAVYLFALSIPIESLLKESLSTGATLARFTGYALLLSALLLAPRRLRRPPPAVWLFAAFLVVAALRSLFLLAEQPELIDAIGIYLSQRAQLLVALFLLSVLLTDERTIYGALLSFGLGACILSITVLLSASGSAALERATAYGEDPNHVGGVLTLGALIALGLSTRHRNVAVTLLRWGAVALFLAAATATGSRGALILFVVGAGILHFPRLRRRPVTTAAALLLGASLTAYAFRDSPALARWADSLQSHDLSERDSIYSSAVDMFLEQPLFGWGPVGHFLELGRRVPSLSWNQPDAIGTHNTLLGTATSVGLVGLVPFVLALYACVRNAHKSRASAQGYLRLALVIGAILFGMSIDADRNKAYWFFLAFGAAARSAGATFPPKNGVPSA
jgi:O-antigen ligase